MYPGMIVSGLGSGVVTNYYPRCSKCNCILGNGGNHVQIVGVSGLYVRMCWSCANYRWDHERKGFETREDWIREVVPPNLSDAPAGIVADWLYDQSRYKEAEYMRGLESGG